MGTNLTTEQMLRFSGQLHELEMQVLRGTRDLRDVRPALQAIIDGQFGQPSSAESYPIIVDYSKSLQQMIEAGGYDYANPDITAEHFPVAEGQAELEAVLLHFNLRIGSDEALQLMGAQGFRAGSLPELCAFGARHPDVQRQFPIVALGSVWTDSGGSRFVASLWGNHGKRSLFLDWFEDDWDPYYRFLAFRKS